MDTRSLNRLVTIQEAGTDRDEMGQIVEDWTIFAVLWADVRHLTGIETIKAGAEASLVKASVRVRYRAGITAGMRLMFEGVPYDIQAVLPDEQHRVYVDLLCERGDE